MFLETACSSGKGDMSPKVILISSLCLNAGLGLALMWPKGGSVQQVELTSAAPVQAGQSVVKKHPTPEPQVVTNVVRKRFSWRQVESADYREYIARLRGIHCPEATIQDIIIADIDKLYEPKFAALRDPPSYEPQKYWQSYYNRRRKKADPEKTAQIKALTEEKEALIKELLGLDEKEWRKSFNSYGVPDEERLAYLPPEKWAQVKELEKKFGEMRSKIYEEAGGYIDMETQKDLAKVRKDMLGEMQKFMTPEEVFEYNVRTSDTARNLQYQLRGLDTTEDEFRAIFAAKEVEENARYALMGDEKPSKEERKQQQEANKQAEDQLKQLLGDDRYKEMKLNQDYAYRSLADAAPYLGFDKSAAMRVVDLKTDAEKAANQVRQNKDLTPDERSEALLKIREAAQAAVTQEIGEKGYKYYRRQGGYWIGNISPVRRSTP